LFQLLQQHLRSPSLSLSNPGSSVLPSGMSSSEGDEVQLDYIETPSGPVPTFESVKKAFEVVREWFEIAQSYLEEDDRRIEELRRRVEELQSSRGSGAVMAEDEEFKQQVLQAIDEIRRRLERIEEELTEVSEAAQLLFEIAERLERSEAKR
jgi:anion-transporting  ArsA/GET3 family ATPase